MKKVFILCTVLAILALAGGLVYYFWAKDTKVPSEFYEDASLGISFNYPEGWLKVKEEDMKDFNFEAVLGFISPETEDTGFGLVINDQLGKGNLKVAESVAQLDKIYADLDNFQKVESGELRVDGVKAVNYIFSFIPPVGENQPKRTITQRQVFFLKNEKLYRLLFSADIREYENNKRNFNLIVKSFKAA